MSVTKMVVGLTRETRDWPAGQSDAGEAGYQRAISDVLELLEREATLRLTVREGQLTLIRSWVEESAVDDPYVIPPHG